MNLDLSQQGIELHKELALPRCMQNLEVWSESEIDRDLVREE